MRHVLPTLLASVLLPASAALASDTDASLLALPQTINPQQDWRCAADTLDAAQQNVCWESDLFAPMVQSFYPALDFTETHQAFSLIFDVPGVEQKDLDVTLSGNRLTVHGRRAVASPAEHAKAYTHERMAGVFTRSFTLPDSADPGHVDARLSNGVLTVTVSKRATPSPHEVSVQTGDTSPKPVAVK